MVAGIRVAIPSETRTGLAAERIFIRGNIFMLRHTITKHSIYADWICLLLLKSYVY